MKKIFIMISVFMVILLSSIQVSAISGEGTKANPYLVETEEDFFVIGYLPDKHYKLMNEISVTDYIPEFSGSFDGNGYCISAENDYIFIENNGEIKNLVINSSNLVEINGINALVSGCTITDGVLATTNNGIITACSSSYIDGEMVVTNDGTINKCTANKGDIVTTNNGIVEDSSIVSTSYQDYIVYNNYGNIKNCSATNNDVSAVVGIVYTNYSTALINECIVVNGRIADINYGNIENCSSSGKGSYAGIAITNNGEISNCSSTKEITSYYYISTFLGYCDRGAGGLVVENGQDAKIINCYYGGMISLYSTTTTDYLKQDTYVGGIAATNKGRIECCYTDNSIYASDYASTGGSLNLHVGGIVGSGGSLINCFSKCYIKAFGRCDRTDEESSSCYACGIGNADVINNCYYYGSLNIMSYTCPVYVAGVSYAGTITNSYYESASPFSDDAEHGTPMASEALKMKLCCTDWDFDTIWAIDPEINDGYPYLQWQYEETEEPVLLDYTINSVKIKNANDEELDSIPETGSCYAEISITKNTDRNEKDYLIIASYDENDALVDFTYMRGLYNQNQEITFGTLLNVHGVKTIKAFVWDGISSMTPLSNFCVFE